MIGRVRHARNFAASFDFKKSGTFLSVPGWRRIKANTDGSFSTIVGQTLFLDGHLMKHKTLLLRQSTETMADYRKTKRVSGNRFRTLLIRKFTLYVKKSYQHEETHLIEFLPDISVSQISEFCRYLNLKSII